MMRLESSLTDLILAGLDGKLPKKANWNDKMALGVVLASQGYPETSSKGDVITGLDSDFEQNIKVFHAGTKQNGEHIVTDGGRVLCITCLASTIKDAQTQALEAIRKIHFDGMQYRRDIGWRAIDR